MNILRVYLMCYVTRIQRIMRHDPGRLHAFLQVYSLMDEYNMGHMNFQAGKKKKAASRNGILPNLHC